MFHKDNFISVLREWEDRVGKRALYENIPLFFPEYGFQRAFPGSPDRDHWYSRLKIDLTQPKTPVREKTVIYRADMKFREQGEWSRGVGAIDKLIADRGLRSIYEAYCLISDTVGLDIPSPKNGEGRTTDASQRRQQLLQALNAYFQRNLWVKDSRAAGSVRNYLRQMRGFTDAQIRAAGFGFVPDWGRVVRYITSVERFSPVELDEACPVCNDEGRTGVGRTYTLSIPYVCAGELKGFLFRRTGEGTGPKYIATRSLDRKGAFFNMPEGDGEKDIIIVEGELDALKATAEGIRNVVAIGGSELAGERRQLIENAFAAGTHGITLCLDLDGRKEDGLPDYGSYYRHVMRSVHTIKDVKMDFEEIRIAVLPEVTDPDGYIRSRGAGAMRELIDGAVPYWLFLYEFHLDHLIRKAPEDND